MITFINTFLKMLVISSLTMYVYYKMLCIKQFKAFDLIKIGCSYFGISLIYAWLTSYSNSITIMIGCILILGIATHITIKNSKQNFWLAYILAFCISYAIYLIAVFIISAITYFVPNISANSPICSVLILIIPVVLVVIAFSTSRLKNGFNFIKSYKGDRNLALVVVIILFCFLLARDVLRLGIDEIKISRVVVFNVIASSIIIFYIISQLITKHYKNNIRDRNISIQKEEIDANEKVIEELKEQNLKLSTTIHKYNHRLSSLESSIRKVMDKSNAEFASELSIVLEQTKKVASQFAEETKVRVHIPSTNVVAIDNMLEYMKNEAIKSNIDFTLKLSDSIKPLLEKYIPEDKFETLLADHIKDAIIAINAKNDGYKSIMVLIGAVQGAYELSIYDTGVEFDIDTLLKLGTEPITTHKENGGSGLGFMTTFETLRLSKASLVIEEYDTSVTNYTKSVTIRFDGKCEYRIYSYRSEEINKACNGRKIIIKKI